MRPLRRGLILQVERLGRDAPFHCRPVQRRRHVLTEQFPHLPLALPELRLLFHRAEHIPDRQSQLQTGGCGRGTAQHQLQIRVLLGFAQAGTITAGQGGERVTVSATIGWAASAVLPDLAAGLVAAFFAALVVLRLRPVAVVEDVVDGVGEPAFAEGFFRDERLSGTVPVTSIDR